MLMFRNYLNKRKGFTLLELIVVIVILGLLAALAIPTFKSIIAKTQDSKAAFELQALARQNVAVSKFTPDAPHLDNLRVWAESNKENNKSQLDTVAKFNDQTPANTEATLISQMGAASPEYGYYSALLPSDKVSDINLAMRSASGNCVSVIVGNQNASLIKTTVKPYEATGANACTAANANAGEVEEETPGNEILAVNERIQTPQGVSKTLSLREANSVYINGPLDVLSATKPANGSTTVSNGEIEYTPDADFIGQDQFSYVISNGTISAKGLITVDVTAQVSLSRAIVLPNASPELTAASNHDNFVYGLLYGDSKLNNNLTISGGSAGQAGFVGLLKADGTWAWAQSLTSDAATAINDVVRQGNNTYVTGSFTGQASVGGLTMTSASNSPVSFVGKINEAGQWAWLKVIETPDTSSTIQGNVDSSGNFIMASSFVGAANIAGQNITEQTASSGNNKSFFVAKITPTGNISWVKTFEGADKNNAAVDVFNIVTDSSGNFFLGGNFKGSWTANGQTFNSSNSSEARDVFIARFNSAGDVIWVKTTSSTGSNIAHSPVTLTRDSSGFLYFGSSPTLLDANSTVTINSTTLTQNDGQTSYVARLSPAGNWSWVQKFTDVPTLTSMSLSSLGQLQVFGAVIENNSSAKSFGGIINPLTGLWLQKTPIAAQNSVTVVNGFATNLSGTGTLSGIYVGPGIFGLHNLGDSSSSTSTFNGYIIDMGLNLNFN